MRFEIFSSELSWVDIVPYIKYQGISGSRNDVDGPNAGRVIQDAMMTRDRLATKYKWEITTIPLDNDTAKMIESLLMPEFFRIRTDFFGNFSQYECYSNNVQKTYVIRKKAGVTYYDYVKLSFPIVQR